MPRVRRRGRAVLRAAGRGSLCGASFATLCLTAAIPAPSGAQAPPPDASYSTVRTEHFRVTFPSELESVGRRAALLAERAHGLLSRAFFPPPGGTIDLLVTDHVDATAGFATPFPSNRIEVWVQPPLDGLALSHFDDWLDLVITHELAHIFHFDYTGVPGRMLRSVFGRAPERWPYFSATAAPFAAIEGIAVHGELALAGSGRLHGTFLDAIVRARAAEGSIERVDQGLGSSPVWPGRNRRYVFGSLFMEYLARTRGEDAVVRFLRELADQWIPFRLDSAARGAFGASFEALWTEWMEEVVREAEALRSAIALRGSGAPIEILTEGGGSALYPDAGPAGVVYVRDDERNDLEIRLRDGEGDRSLGRWNTLHAPPRWGPDGSVLAPQGEFRDAYTLRRDLYSVLPGEGARPRTEGLRVLHADPHPRDGTIAAVLAGELGNRLVLLSPEGRIETVLRAEEPGVLWSFPAWSPEGERLAIVRRSGDGESAVWILDRAGRLRFRVAGDRSQNSSPAWSPEGDVLLWSSDRSGVPNLYAALVPSPGAGAALDPADRAPDPAGAAPTILQVTDVLAAVSFPSVSPDGRWIYVSALDGEGWKLGRLPYDPASWFEAVSPLPRFVDGLAVPAELPPEPALPDAPLEVEPYSAWPTLGPRYWLPHRVEGEGAGGDEVIADRWGIHTSGHDLLGRHRYSLGAAVPLSGPFGRAEGDLWYRWSGLGNPAVVLEGAQDWSVNGRFTLDGGAEPDTVLFATSREQRAGIALEMRRSGVRSLWLLSLGSRWIEEDRHILGMDGRESDVRRFLVPSASLLEPRASVQFSTARAHAFSVSLEDGLIGGVLYRMRTHLALADSLDGVAGADGSLWDVTAYLQAYRGVRVAGFADHVLALRLAAGTSGGPGAGSQHFGVGGSGRFFGVRGVPAGSLRFGAAWAASAEWRFPLRILNRGFGAWPLHLDRLAGALFWDAGGGTPELGSGNHRSTASFGVEAVLTYSLLFQEPERFRAGVAFPSGSGDPAFHASWSWSF